MKKQIRNLIIAAFLITAPFILSAQEPPHPNNGNAPSAGSGNNPVGSAPIDGGLSILIALSMAYGSRKAYKSYQADKH